MQDHALLFGFSTPMFAHGSTRSDVGECVTGDVDRLCTGGVERWSLAGQESHSQQG